MPPERQAASLIMFDKEIIIVTPWFGNFAGGAEVQAASIAIELNRRGVKTKIFTTCSRSPYDSWWEDHFVAGASEVSGIEVRRFSTGNKRARYEAVIEKLQRGDEKLSAQDQEDFFLCGINSDDLTNALGQRIAEGVEIIALPYFQGLTHAVVNRYPHSVSLIPCFHDEPQFYWRATETLLQNAKHIFFYSVEEKEMAVKQYGNRVGRKVVESVVTGGGVELRALAGDVVDDDDGEAFGETLPKNYFVYVGRKERGKNVHLLCQWFIHYAKKFHRDARLLFIGGGDGALIPQDERLIDCGFVSERRKQRIIKSAKGLINLSRNESFSLVLMEAWLLGVPTVVNAECAVTRGHVRRSQGGLYVQNEDEFAGALNYLEENREAAHKLGLNGQRYVKANFSFDTVLHKYLRELSASRG